MVVLFCIFPTSGSWDVLGLDRAFPPSRTALRRDKSAFARGAAGALRRDRFAFAREAQVAQVARFGGTCLPSRAAHRATQLRRTNTELREASVKGWNRVG